MIKKSNNKGRGHVQLAIMNALKAEPDKWFTVQQLAKVVYRYKDSIGEAQLNAVYRTLKDCLVKRAKVKWSDKLCEIKKGTRPIKVKYQNEASKAQDEAARLAAIADLAALKSS